MIHARRGEVRMVALRGAAADMASGIPAAAHRAKANGREPERLTKRMGGYGGTERQRRETTEHTEITEEVTERN